MRTPGRLLVRGLRWLNDAPLGPWMVLAYMGLVILFVLGNRLDNNTVKRDTLSATAVIRCKESIPFIRALGGISDLGDDIAGLANIQRQNTRDALDNTPLGDPLRASRERALARIERTQARLARDRARVATLGKIPIPTRRQCEARR